MAQPADDAKLLALLPQAQIDVVNTQILRALTSHIGAYLDLLKNIVILNAMSDDEIRATRGRIDAVDTMLACLRRRKMVFFGVETRPGRPFQMDSSWIPGDTPPANDSGTVELLWHMPGVDNPGHDGYGPDYWVRERPLQRGPQDAAFAAFPMETGAIVAWRHHALSGKHSSL
jgi:hypothetical protein